MKKIIVILLGIFSSSSVFAVPREVIIKILSESKIVNIRSITEEKGTVTPKCLCQTLKITGVDAAGNEISETVEIEYTQDVEGEENTERFWL